MPRCTTKVNEPFHVKRRNSRNTGTCHDLCQEMPDFLGREPRGQKVSPRPYFPVIAVFERDRIAIAPFFIPILRYAI